MLNFKDIIEEMALLALIIIVLVVSSVFIPGCTPIVQTEYITQHLTHPPRPILPKIAPLELQCITQETYQKLYDRQRLITDYAVELETIIESTK